MDLIKKLQELVEEVLIMHRSGRVYAYEESEEAWKKFLTDYGKLVFVTNHVYTKAKQIFPQHPIFEYLWESGFDILISLPAIPSSRNIFGEKYPDKDWVIRNRQK